MPRRAVNAVTIGALVGLVGLLARIPCAVDSWGATARDYTLLCYSDVGPLYFVRGFANGVVPYLQNFQGEYLEYPVLTGGWAWATSLLTQLVAGGASVGWFVLLTWLASLGFISVAIWAMSNTVDHRRRAFWFALSPAILLTLGINWDALPVMCVALAMMFWSQERRLPAAIALGLGAAAKLYPALLLVPFLASLPGRNRRKQSIAVIATFTLSWLAVNLPVAWQNPAGWWRFYEFSRERGIDFGSVWLATDYLFGWHRTTDFVNNFGLIAVAAAAVCVLLLGRRLDWATGALVMVGVFALVNKVYSPQYWLWLAPLVAMAVRSRTEWVLWNLAQLGYFIGIWRHLLFVMDKQAAGGLDALVYGRITLLQWGATAAVILLSVFHSLREGRWRNRSGRLRL